MRLKELREEKKLTQSQVANAIGTNQRNIGRWENKENEPTAGFIMQLADFFECSADYLLGRSDDLGNVTVKRNESLSFEEEKFLADLRALSTYDSAKVLKYVRELKEKNE